MARLAPVSIGRMKVTLDQGATLATQLKTVTDRQIARVRAATDHSSERALEQVVAACPKDTHWMADHTRVKPIDDHLGYQVGWYRRDFVGQFNPVSNKVMTTFYPEHVVRGARGKAGRDPLTPALRAERGAYRKGCQRAIAGG